MSKGHIFIKDILKDMEDDPKPISALTEGNSYTTFLHRKAGKIVAAIYLVTNLFSDEEPMKWKLRHEGITLLGELPPLNHKEISKDRANSITTTALSVESLIEVGVHGGLISDMNASVLRAETGILLEAVRDRFRERFIPETFFSVPKPTEEIQNQQTHRGTSGGSRSNNSKTTAASGAGSVRQKKILDLIRQKKEVSIADVALEVQDCSEKTLLRDLKRLIDAGGVKKIGERRWTRYSQAKAE